MPASTDELGITRCECGRAGSSPKDGTIPCSRPVPACIRRGRTRCGPVRGNACATYQRQQARGKPRAAGIRRSYSWTVATQNKHTLCLQCVMRACVTLMYLSIYVFSGAMNATEKSVSVRWDADMSTLRGPYYTGEQGKSMEKFKLSIKSDTCP